MTQVVAGLLVLYVELFDGSIKRMEEWGPTEANYQACQDGATYWTAITGRWAECGQEL